MKFTGTSLGERMLWKPTTECKLWKPQSRPLDDHPMDRSGGGTIWHVAPHSSHPSLRDYERRRRTSRRYTPPLRESSRDDAVRVARRHTGPRESSSALPGRFVSSGESPPRWPVDKTTKAWSAYMGRRPPQRLGRQPPPAARAAAASEAKHRRWQGIRCEDLLFSFQGLLGKQRLRSLMVGGFKWKNDPPLSLSIGWPSKGLD